MSLRIWITIPSILLAKALAYSRTNICSIDRNFGCAIVSRVECLYDIRGVLRIDNLARRVTAIA
jgi:hypothetical protein